MSLAGRRSNQGDRYQLCVALYWLIKLLSDDGIKAIQVDSTGIPGREYPITVDDIVVIYKDGKTRYIQAKKNQPTYRAWSFSDLKEELIKVRDQLKSDENSEVEFYSRSGFGDFRVMVETCKLIPSYDAFLPQASDKHRKFLTQFSSSIDCSDEESFGLAKRIEFGMPLSFDEWDSENLRALKSQVSRAEEAIPYLEKIIANHESSLSAGSAQITREDILEELQKHGLSPAPAKSVIEILSTFSTSSQIGRNWIRTVGDTAITRPELAKLVQLIEEGKQSVLLAEGAGSGKTCLLLDLADYIEDEKAADWGLLFIKGDQFLSAKSESDLVNQGLPENIVGQCARLSESRCVVVIIDSLDVLSLNRQHGSLKLFTGLISRLACIQNVTTVAACRTFDLDYDPALRGLKWDSRVYIQLLNFEISVVPLLKEWEIDPDSISPELAALLRIPQNLRLYKQIIDSGVSTHATSAYSLSNSFVQEVILKNDSLGDISLEGLYRMVKHLNSCRSQYCSRDVLELDETVIRALISQNVLVSKSPEIVGLSHQTLADCLTIRAAISRQQTLKDFILSQPQLPFLRPFVRAFLFHLRAHQPDQFSRQVAQVISSQEVSYHVKRLICESLAEIKPSSDDWPLFRRLHHTEPDLLKRTFIRLERMGATYGTDWFFFLSENWLPLAQSTEPDQKSIWLRLFLQTAHNWMNELPEEVVQLWQQAIEESWCECRTLARVILGQISQFRFIQANGIRAILEGFLSNAALENEQYDSYLSQAISLWIEATDSSDELIWQYMTKKIADATPDATDHSQTPYEGLRCQPRTFHKESFLTERFNRSDVLLDLSISALKSWSQTQYGRSFSSLLGKTSWEDRHTQCSPPRHVDDIHFLMREIEKAIQSRASISSEWWKGNVKDLLDSEEDAIAYFAVRACNGNIAGNISEIEHCLSNQNLLFESRLTDEIGELMRDSYPYLSPTVQIATQRLIVEYCNNTDADSEVRNWHLYGGYKLVCWIPIYLRTAETQALINHCQDKFGRRELSPQVHLSGGIMSISPLNATDVLNLSDASVLKLFAYYSKPVPESSVSVYSLEGSSIDSTVRELSRIDPIRFLDLSSLFSQNNINRRYLRIVLEGASEHLRHRFANLSFGKNLEMVMPLPGGELIAAAIIKILERYPSLFRNGRAVASILEGCCSVISDEEMADRVTMLLLWLLSDDSNCPPPITPENQHDLRFDAVNSGLGIAADSALLLYNRLLEHNTTPPSLLLTAILRLSQNEQEYVNVVPRLPYTIYKNPTLGWQLLNNIFNRESSFLWKEAESIFYYNYANSFGKVKPYLDRLAEEISENNGEVWGRISTLSSLSGHIPQSLLFHELSSLNDSAAEGTAQVFCANLGISRFRNDCKTGLHHFLQLPSCSKAVLKRIEKCFSTDKRLSLDYSFSHSFLEACHRAQEPVDLFLFPEWLAVESRKNPVAALNLLEKLVAFVSTEGTSIHAYGEKELIETLIEIEREADELDDLDMIQRTIRLQDQFLSMDLYGMNVALDSSARL